RTACSCYREGACKRRANYRRDRRNFVFGLKRANVEILVPRKLVKNVARRRDRIAAIEERLVRQTSSRNQTHRQRFIARDLAISPRRDFRRRYEIPHGEHVRRLAEIISCAERLQIRAQYVGLLAKFIL